VSAVEVIWGRYREARRAGLVRGAAIAAVAVAEGVSVDEVRVALSSPSAERVAEGGERRARRAERRAGRVKA
jgi:hypothetical protein